MAERPRYLMRMTLLLVMVLTLCAGCGRHVASPDDTKPESRATNAEPHRDRAAPLGWTAMKERAAESTDPIDRQLAQRLATVEPDQVRWVSIDPLPTGLFLLESVFWDPRDTTSLREWIFSGGEVEGKRVLEIGTGSGLLALCCLHAGAHEVVATDINPTALVNAAGNAWLQGVRHRLDLRQVPADQPDAFAVIGDNERFDLIISNPPWEDGHADQWADYAFFDERFHLMRSLLDRIGDHLHPGGRVMLAYGCVSAIRQLETLASERGLAVTRHDDRDLDQLPEVFLLGMLLEVHVR